MAGDGGDLRETIIVRKTADENTANDATLNDDSTLLIPIAANEVLIVELWASVEWNGGGIRCAFNGPAATTNIEYWVQVDRDDGTMYQNQGSWWDTVVVVAPDIARIGQVRGVCLVENGANAGNIIFRWAQQAAHANNTTVKRGSWIRSQRIA